jgi:hypothetical protein
MQPLPTPKSRRESANIVETSNRLQGGTVGFAVFAEYKRKPVERAGNTAPYLRTSRNSLDLILVFENLEDNSREKLALEVYLLIDAYPP